MIGLDRKRVQLVEHFEAWAASFSAEREVLYTLFGEDAMDIQHAGSTSIHGICAKPIIDIAVGLAALEVVSDHQTDLEKEGYEYRTNAGGEDRVFYAKGPQSCRTHYLHLVVYESDAWKDLIYFRDYLNTHPDMARAYEEQKIDLAQKYPEDRAQYSEGKSAFIKEIIQREKDSHEMRKA